MPTDISNKLSKKGKNESSNKRDEINKRKKKNGNNDSDDDFIDSENDEMDVHEYRKFISKIFPSKHLNKKIMSGEKLKKIAQDIDTEDEESEEDWETDTEEDEEVTVKKGKNKKGKNKKSKNKKSKNKKSKNNDASTDEDEPSVKKPDGKLNIIFTIGKKGEIEDEDDEDWNEEDYDPDYDEEDPDTGTEDEDEDVSTDDSDYDSEDETEDDAEDDTEDDTEDEVPIKSKKHIVTKQVTKNDENTKDDNANDAEVLDKLKELLNKNPNNKSIKKCIDVYEEDEKSSKRKVEKKRKKQKDKNLRIFRKIIKDKNTMNDFSFYEKLEIEKQKKVIKEMREINKITRVEKPYRMTLLEAEIPVEFKTAAMKKINSLRYIEPGSGEFYKIKNWVDTFMRIPFGKHKGLPISIDDGVDKCHDFMESAKQTLDQAVYGLNDAKMQIMQMLGQLLTNPKAIGTAIAIHGPPGTGKTSLVKEGISKILNRPFAFIALGGATDSSYLEGHSYTYEGSVWGKIVQILIDSNCMNPVIYFDELDKISGTPKGEEITGILTHLTDTSQNSQFHDKYFTEVNFDLSKCLFIFSYNDETKVNPILKDRMYRIKTKGYSGKEKSLIANNYLLPKINEQVRFNKDDIIIPNDVIGYIVENHCNKEDGVRNLKRCLEIIYTKLNLYRLMKPGTNLFEGDTSLKVEFPFTVTKVIVDKLIKKESDGLETWRSLYL
jgi:ATP-dependent Lon protease